MILQSFIYLSSGWLAQTNALYKHGFAICNGRNAHLIDRMASQFLVIFLADDIFAANWDKCLITINIAFKQDRILNFFQQKTCLCKLVFCRSKSILVVPGVRA